MTGGSSQPAGNTTTTTTNTPWGGQVPFLEGGQDWQGNTVPGVLPTAAQLYQTGGPQYYPGQVIATPSDNTLLSQQMELAYGTNPSPLLDSASQGATNMTAPGFLTSTPSDPIYSSIANGGGVNPATGLAQSIATNTPGNATLSGIASSTAPTAASQYLTPYANGSMVNNDPNLMSAMAATNNLITQNYQTAIAPQIESGMEAAGRYGSGASANAMGQGQQQLASSLSNADLNLLNNNYQTQTQNQITAANAMNSANATQTGLQTNAANSLAGNDVAAASLYGTMGQQNIANVLNAATGLGTDYNNAASNSAKALAFAPSVSQMPLSGIAAVNDVGQQQTTLDQNQINALINQYNYNQTLPYQNLATYDQLIQGNYGGTATTAQPYYNSGSSQLGGALGGAASGAALGTAISPGYGTAAGAVIGGLLGLFGSSK